jgi:hypothetical protein
LPVPNSSLDNAAFASGANSLLFLLIVSTPPSSAETFLAFEEDASPCRPGLEVMDRLLGIEMGDGGSACIVYGASGSVSSGFLGLSDMVVIVGVDGRVLEVWMGVCMDSMYIGIGLMG